MSDVRAQAEVKDEAQSLGHSPKCIPTTLYVKLLGNISPVLNQILAVEGHLQPQKKLPSKEIHKSLALKSSEITEPAQMLKPTQ